MERRALALAITMLASPAVASRCPVSCRAEVKACRSAECGGLRGRERHGCVEHCRGRIGCPAHIRTLAYVVTDCHSQGEVLRGGQELIIRRGDCDPVRVLRLD